jgi:acetylornithine deacetylase/succinyl-diaminopimelate desuccinylase-like protein
MDIRGYMQKHSAGFSAALSEWLAIPSISANPAHHGDVRRSAEWIARHLRSTGFPVVEIWDPPAPGGDAAPGGSGHTGRGLPTVYAEWPATGPAAPAVLVYGHHDVQPAEPLQEWDSDPFQPARRGDQLFGRGASDDKGQVLFHALGVSACTSGRGEAGPPVTLKLHVAAHTPPAIRTRVEFSGPGVRPCSSPIGSPAVRAARGAMERAFGREVLFTREGGSGPDADLADILGAPLVFLAVGLDSDAIHAPNERVEISRLLKGAEAAAYLWQDLAAYRPGELAAAAEDR